MNVTADALAPGSTGNSSDTDPSLSKDNTPEFKPPSDGSWVPRERLNRLNAKVEDLSKQIEKQEKVQNTPEPVSRSELRAKVDAGEISQDASDEILEQQLETRVADQLETVVKDTAHATKLQQELAAYEKNVPELSDENSELYASVAREYRYLVHTIGMPDTTSTTLVAVRSVVGPANALKKIEITKFQPGDDGHPENSGGGDGGGQTPAGKKPQLNARQKAHYENAIRCGAYKDMKEVYEELGYKA